LVVVFRVLYIGACLLSIAAGALVIASHFIPERAPQSTDFLGIHLAVSAIFLVVGIVLFGIERHLDGIAAMVLGHDGETARELVTHVNRLLAYLIAGGAFLCTVLGSITYAIMERIDQGFAVFG
jgi:hypothetical protein